jgi:hypothetical protein
LVFRGASSFEVSDQNIVCISHLLWITN